MIFPKARYARKLKKKAKMQGKKGTETAKSSAQEPTARTRCRRIQHRRGRLQLAFTLETAARNPQKLLCRRPFGHGGADRRRQRRHPTVHLPPGPAWNRSVEKGKTAVSTAVKRALRMSAKSNAHVLVIVGVFLLLILMVMSGFSSCGILFSGRHTGVRADHVLRQRTGTSGAQSRTTRSWKRSWIKIKRTPTDHPGYNEYQYHLDPIEHDPWQLTSFLTTLYDDYTRSEVQGKLKETFKSSTSSTTWVEVQTRYMTVWVISPAGIPVPTQVPYEYRIFHTKLVNKGLEVVIREELDNDQWKRYEIFQDTLGGRPYLFNGGLPPGGSDGSGAPGIDYQVPAEALTDSEFAAIYKEAQKYVGTPYVWGGSTPETGFDCSRLRLLGLQPERLRCRAHHRQRSLATKARKFPKPKQSPVTLCFFEGTYDTPGKSHAGHLLSATARWCLLETPSSTLTFTRPTGRQYLSGFGRLSK
ncbi:MAG: CD1108 family mobile element protein [Faecalibacterium prausnitzii]